MDRLFVARHVPLLTLVVLCFAADVPAKAEFIYGVHRTQSLEHYARGRPRPAPFLFAVASRSDVKDADGFEPIPVALLPSYAEVHFGHVGAPINHNAPRWPFYGESAWSLPGERHQYDRQNRFNDRRFLSALTGETGFRHQSSRESSTDASEHDTRAGRWPLIGFRQNDQRNSGLQHLLETTARQFRTHHEPFEAHGGTWFNLRGFRDRGDFDCWPGLALSEHEHDDDPASGGHRHHRRHHHRCSWHCRHHHCRDLPHHAPEPSTFVLSACGFAWYGLVTGWRRRRTPRAIRRDPGNESESESAFLRENAG